MRCLSKSVLTGQLHPALFEACSHGPVAVAVALEGLGKEFIATPESATLVGRFHTALQILTNNAERLERLAELAEEQDGDADEAGQDDESDIADAERAGSPEEDRSIHDMLDAYVPAADEHPAIAETQQLPAAQREVQAVVVAPTPRRTPMSAPGSETKREPKRETKSAAKPGTTPISPGQADRGAETTRPGTADARGVQPGAKRTGPREHWHPRGHKRLSKQELQKRVDKLKAVELQMIGRFDKWTPELAELLRQRRREQRQ
jgi:hypothetical protein